MTDWPPADAADDALAAAIWRSVVRDTLTPPPHYRSWLASRPARQVGGDFHLATGSWVAVGDVSGKGVPAALLTGMLVASLKLALRLPDPVRALEHALFEELERAGMFTTLAAVELGADGWLSYLNAGHPPALIRRKRAVEIEALAATAPPIGTFLLDAVPLRGFRLEPGDLVCLYSDGLLDLEREGEDERFGLARLSELLRRHAEPDEAFACILDATRSWRRSDDLTLVLLEYAPQDGWERERLDRR